MGVYARPDSKFWWIRLEGTNRRQATDILVGGTAAQRHDSRKLADALYHQQMNAHAARLYRLPTATPAIRFDKYAETYKTDVIAQRRGSDREGWALKTLVADFGSEILSTIDQDRVRAYIKRRRLTVSAATVNREVGLLKTMLRDAVPKYLAVNPLAGMSQLKVIKPRRRLMTSADEKKLLAVGDAYDRAILIVGVDTMLRLGDLLDLERADRSGPWLFVRDPKGGEPFEVALTPRAMKALAAIPGKDRYYFSKFRRAEKPRDWPGSVRQRLERMCEEADIPYGKKAGGITFHWATRRTGATRLLVKRRVSVPVVQRLGNWKTPDVLLEIYAEADRKDLLAAVGQITSRSRGKRKRA
jgi:integrase